MASGDLLAAFGPLGYEPPASNYATIGVRNAHPTLDFDAATQEGANWTGVMPPNYGGGNIVCAVTWMAATATTGAAVWDSTIEAIPAQDLDSDGFATAQQAAAATTNATSGVVTKTTVTHTAGAAGTDSIAAGDPFRLRIRRVAADAGDTMAGDAQIVQVVLTEA